MDCKWLLVLMGVAVVMVAIGVESMVDGGAELREGGGVSGGIEGAAEGVADGGDDGAANDAEMAVAGEVVAGELAGEDAGDAAAGELKNFIYFSCNFGRI